MRSRPRFALEMILVLVVKVAAMAVIWAIWFSDPHPPTFAPERIGGTEAVPASSDVPRASHARP